MATKKVVKKAVKKEIKKEVWGASTDKALASIKIEAKKNKNAFIFVCTAQEETAGTGVHAMLHNAGDLSIAIVSMLRSIDERAPGAVERGLLKFLASR
jgi:hypothetical protein